MNKEEFLRQALKILRKAELDSEPEESESPIKKEILQKLLEGDRVLDAERRTNVVFLFGKPDDTITVAVPTLRDSKQPSAELAPARILVPFTLVLFAICAGLSANGFSVMPSIALCCGAVTAWFVVQIGRKSETFNKAGSVLAYTAVKVGVYLPAIVLARSIGLFPG